MATIDGDFDWVDSDGDGSCEAAEFDAAISYADWSADSDSTCNQLVWNGTPGNTTNTGFFEVPGDVILNPVDWIGNVEWTYSLGSASGTTDQAWDPGIWTINGAQVYIQYMPYGTNISRIIYAANKGLINADATADVYYNGAVTQCDLGCRQQPACHRAVGGDRRLRRDRDGRRHERQGRDPPDVHCA